MRNLGSAERGLYETLRLGRGEKVALSEGGTLPPALEAAAVRWHACLVASPDFQDLRAAVRWLDLVRGDEQEIIRLAINRAPSLEPGDQQRPFSCRSAAVQSGMSSSDWAIVM